MRDERYCLKFIDVLSEQPISHMAYVGAKTVKEVKLQFLRKHVEVVFYWKSGVDYEAHLNDNELLKVETNPNSASKCYCAFFRINYNAHGEKTSLQSNTYACSRRSYIINLPRIRVCINDEKTIVTYQGNSVRPWLCSFTNFKNNHKILSGFPMKRVFFYCKSDETNVVIEDTKTWLHHMSIAGQFDKDFVVYVGLLSQPERGLRFVWIGGLVFVGVCLIFEY